MPTPDEVVVSSQLGVSVICPAAPLLLLTSDSREPLVLVTTLAVTPYAPELIALARVASVLLVEFSVIVCAAPDPI